MWEPLPGFTRPGRKSGAVGGTSAFQAQPARARHDRPAPRRAFRRAQSRRHRRRLHQLRRLGVAARGRALRPGLALAAQPRPETPEDDRSLVRAAFRSRPAADEHQHNRADDGARPAVARNARCALGAASGRVGRPAAARHAAHAGRRLPAQRLRQDQRRRTVGRHAVHGRPVPRLLRAAPPAGRHVSTRRCGSSSCMPATCRTRKPGCGSTAGPSPAGTISRARCGPAAMPGSRSASSTWSRTGGIGKPVEAFLLGVLEAQIDALLKLQAPSGAWHTLLDDPSSYEEMSATAGIGYGLMKAARIGIGPQGCGPAGRRALERCSPTSTRTGCCRTCPTARAWVTTCNFIATSRSSPTGYGQALAILCLTEGMIHAEASEEAA